MYLYEPCRAWGEGVFDSSNIYHHELFGEECAGLVRRCVFIYTRFIVSCVCVTASDLWSANTAYVSEESRSFPLTVKRVSRRVP